MLGGALGLRRLLRIKCPRSLSRMRGTPFRQLPLLLCIAAGMMFYFLPTRAERQTRGIVQPQTRHGWIRRLLREQIPPAAAVAAAYDLICQLPARERMFPLTQANLDRGEYWIIDLHAGANYGTLRRDELRRILNLMRERVAAGRAALLLNQDRFLVLRNLEYPSVLLHERQREK